MGAEHGLLPEVATGLCACAGRGELSRCLGLWNGHLERLLGLNGHLSSAPAMRVALVYPLKEFLLNITV